LAARARRLAAMMTKEAVGSTWSNRFFFFMTRTYRWIMHPHASKALSTSYHPRSCCTVPCPGDQGGDDPRSPLRARVGPCDSDPVHSLPHTLESIACSWRSSEAPLPQDAGSYPQQRTWHKLHTVHTAILCDWVHHARLHPNAVPPVGSLPSGTPQGQASSPSPGAQQLRKGFFLLTHTTQMIRHASMMMATCAYHVSLAHSTGSKCSTKPGPLGWRASFGSLATPLSRQPSPDAR
jgi:hypothetical protein